jgi:hypothetical protein
MWLTEAQDQQSAEAWSADEELVIATIQQTESVPRAEGGCPSYSGRLAAAAGSSYATFSFED